MEVGQYINKIIQNCTKMGRLHFKEKKYYYNSILNKFKYSFFDLAKRKPIVIYGAGRLGRYFFYQLKKKKLNIAGFIDRNRDLIGTKISEKPILSLKAARNKFLSNPIIVASILYENQISKLLLKTNFKYIFTPYLLNIVYPKIFFINEYNQVFEKFTDKKNQLLLKRAYDLLFDDQSKMTFKNLINYRLTGDRSFLNKAKSSNVLFHDHKILKLTDKEIYVDCGAYDGDTIRLFLDRVKNKFLKIFAFEPDDSNFSKLKNWIKKVKKSSVYCYKQGVYSSDKIVQFDNTGSVDAKILSDRINNKSTYTNIKVVKIDSFFKKRSKPTLIKMDIEGSELEALEGAKSIIKNYQPKLAISIYHRPNDFWEIILFLNRINPGYKFYVRHYSSEFADTICYAV